MIAKKINYELSIEHVLIPMLYVFLKHLPFGHDEKLGMLWVDDYHRVDGCDKYIAYKIHGEKAVGDG